MYERIRSFMGLSGLVEGVGLTAVVRLLRPLIMDVYVGLDRAEYRPFLFDLSLLQ